MRVRIMSGVALAVAILLGMSACDDPSSTILFPDESLSARSGHADDSVPLRLMSRNMYLGGNIDHILDDPVNGPDIAWAEILYTNYPARAAVMAQEIASRRPHLVGLQEVSLYVVLDAATFQPQFTINYLEILLGALAARGLPYDIAATSMNFQAYIPMGGFIVFYMDGDAILKLAHPSVVVENPGWKHFDKQVDLDEYVPGLGENLRSYQWVDAAVEGRSFRFLNTHLEVQAWDTVQVQQTAELLEFLSDHDGPVFMVGDFNSAANRNAPERAKTATYQMILEAGFDDLWLPHNGVVNNSGASCCQASDLANRASELDERIDFIFARGVSYWKKNRAAAAKLELLGHRPSDRFLTSNPLAPQLGEYWLWPSDHAGLFGEIWVDPWGGP